MSISLNVILDTRRIKNKIKKFPLKLRVTFNRQSKYYTTIFNLTEDEFKKLNASRISSDLDVVRKRIKVLEGEAQKAIDEIETFSFDDFEHEFVNRNTSFITKNVKRANAGVTFHEFDFTPFEKRYSIFRDDHTMPGTISITYLKYIKQLLKDGRIGTAYNYHNSYKAIISFKGNIKFSDITVSYLNQFESWMLSRNISKTTIGIYLRPFRAIFNEAIFDGVVKREKYPFGRRKYIIPSGRCIKKALDAKDICQIYYHKSVSGTESEQKAKDFWFFSYFGNGMNIKDIALLKYKNLQDQFIIFERAKTERATRGDSKLISVFITPDMQKVIDRWGNKSTHADSYIFPILEDGVSPQRQYDLIQLFIKFVNDWMKLIKDDIGIEKKVTTYVARHSFSTTLKRNGASLEFISEALGHSDVKTTEHYLASFDNETKKMFANTLDSFKNHFSEL
jgi:integrase